MRKINYNKVRHFLCLTLLFFSNQCLPQGNNSNFLLGYQAKAKMSFTDTSYSILSEVRTIPFLFTQGNISDENGNILMSSNGVFIADATGDTMLGGGGLNPNSFTDDFKQYGLVLPYGNIILPMPDDSNKYVLFHQTGNYNSLPSSLSSTEIYHSIIDISLNGGLGSVISKNNITLTGLFGWGLSACKHGNGRDWWIIALNDSATIAYKFLLTPNNIHFENSQILQTPFSWGYSGQPVFSPNGEKYAFGGSYAIVGQNYQSRINLFHFDRCTGFLNIDTTIDYSDGYISYAAAFSPDSKYLYFSTAEHIYQIDADTSDIGATFQLVATNDSFTSTVPPFYTNFHLMYLAANGKIYISSTNGVKHLHEINYPDSAGMACGVQLHNVFTDCYFGGVPNHPNYYLGRLVGSACDTLTNINDLTEHDFKFKIFPNPNNGNFKIMYLLPQNKAGRLEIFDVNGRVVYSQNLPQWSTLQYISLPKISNGVYNCVITSGGERGSRKLVVFRE
jgi:hypothetical protein